MNDSAPKMNITEEMHLEKEWYEEARKQTIESLPDFMWHLMNHYNHDYGTVVHAVSACALAAAWAANKMDGARGGITGFQAGFVMWDFVKQWSYTNNKAGLRIINYDNFLYPQYGDDYDKVMDPETWRCLQEEAKRRLEKIGDENGIVADEVKLHWQSIVNGKVPFGYKVKEVW